MRYPDGTLIGDLNDSVDALTSRSIVSYSTSSIDENQTTYNLLPVVVNRPPVIIQSIREASQPIIQSANSSTSLQDTLYTNLDGTVQVCLGTSFTLKVLAQQPNVLNIQNGIPEVIIPTMGLTYTWNKDSVVISGSVNQSLQSTIVIDNNTITFTNIQPDASGTYTCDVANDVGITTSEPIVIEVINLDFNSYFYTNLIQNPNGEDGTDNWNSSTEDLITKPFSKIASQEFKKPNRIDIFGYTADMMHPRPYQINTGVIKNYNLVDSFINKTGTYFTRSRYKFLKAGGTFLVKATQEIDLSDIQWYIKGGVYGVSSVKAMFSCYIGNAIAKFIPTQALVDPSGRIEVEKYDMTSPRISTSNFKKAGPSWGAEEKVTIMISEYDSSNTRLSTYKVFDPYQRIPKQGGEKFIAILNNIDYLYNKNVEEYYTYGQYIRFAPLDFNLNSNTSKIKVSIIFETQDWRLTQVQDSGEVEEFVGWETPFRNNWDINNPNPDTQKLPPTWDNFIRNQIKHLPRNDKKVENSLTIYPVSNDPRGLVTGLNLALIPNLTQDSVTAQYISSTLKLNNTPESKVLSGLLK